MPTLNLDLPLQTRDGRQVRIYARDGAVGQEIHGAILIEGDGWRWQSWNPDGKCGSMDHLSLVNVPQKIVRKVWVNFYSGYGPDLTHKDKPSADRCASDRRIACKEFTLEAMEGEGL